MKRNATKSTSQRVPGHATGASPFASPSPAPTPPIEEELQLELLSRDGFEALASGLGRPQRILQQTNLYFDTPDKRWRAMGYSPRLRRENEDLFLTLKGPSQRAQGVATCPEWEQKVEGDWDQLRLGGPALQQAVRALIQTQGAQLPDELDPAKLELVKGTLQNTRRVFAAPQCPPHVHLELDLTRYPDQTESYLLEVEVPSGVSTGAIQEKVEALLKALGVQWRPSPMGKRARLEQAMEHLGATP